MRMRLGTIRERKERALRVGVRLERVYRRKRRALRVGVRLRRVLRMRISSGGPGSRKGELCG